METVRYKTSIFLFRRDLRIDDNTGLIKAMYNSDRIIPLFIFSDNQMLSENNKYKSNNCVQFMIESLIDLNSQIKYLNPKSRLWVARSKSIGIDVLKKIITANKVDAIYLNRDYTTYSINRDKEYKKLCKELNINIHSYEDIPVTTKLLDISTKTNTKYKIFTKFYNNASEQKVRKPCYNIESNIIKSNPDYKLEKYIQYYKNKNEYTENDNIAFHGGRKNGLKILAQLSKFKKYESTRNDIHKPTTLLSAHNKFGTVSIREVYYEIKKKSQSDELIKQLYWRDFYYYVCYHYRHIESGKHVAYPDNKFIWNHNKNHLNAFLNGETGFPIVDAAIRELKHTGYIHNRLRMIVANFLSKDLMINWKKGEQLFSNYLIDYDPLQNVGNWNWCASFGLDNAAFVRILNPWTQLQEHDNDCSYVKKWISELKDVPNIHIQKWYKYHDKYDIKYPEPIVDHKIQHDIFSDTYRQFVYGV
jgi:deoxyribodipyrimidine photo-lyase